MICRLDRLPLTNLPKEIEESGGNGPYPLPRLALLLWGLLFPVLKINGKVGEYLINPHVRIPFFEKHTMTSIQ